MSKVPPNSHSVATAVVFPAHLTRPPLSSAELESIGLGSLGLCSSFTGFLRDFGWLWRLCSSESLGEKRNTGWARWFTWLATVECGWASLGRVGHHWALLTVVGAWLGPVGHHWGMVGCSWPPLGPVGARLGPIGHRWGTVGCCWPPLGPIDHGWGMVGPHWPPLGPVGHCWGTVGSR